MEKSGNPLITRLSKLPSKRPSESTAEIFSDDSLPAVEILQRYKPKLEVSSEYLFYDGVNNNFTPHPSGGNKRKRGSNSKSAPPRPANSFLCARSLIQPMLRQLSITNGRVSLIMSDVSISRTPMSFY